MEKNDLKIRWYMMTRFRIFLVFLVLSLGILLIVSTFLANRIRDFALEDTNEFIYEEAHRLQENVDTHLEGIEHAVHILSVSQPVLDLDFEEADRIFHAYIEQQPSVSQLFIINADGQQIHKTSHLNTLGDRSDRGYFQEAIKGKSVFSDVIISRSTNIPIVVHAQPIIRDGKIDGVIGASIDLSSLSLMVGHAGHNHGHEAEDHEHDDEAHDHEHEVHEDEDEAHEHEVREIHESYGFIVEATGKVIAHPDYSFVEQQFDASYLEPVQDVLKGNKGIGIYTYDGVDKITAYLPSKRAEWGVFYQVPMYKAIEEVGYINRLMIYTAITMILLVALGFIASSQWTQKPLQRVLQMILHIEEGHDLKAYTVQKNEYGIIEKKLMDMADKIKRSHQALEGEVWKRTKELEMTMEELVATQETLERLNDDLREQSLTDALTRLPNRRYLNELLQVNWDRTGRDQRPIAIAILDIDWFKNYNDTYGHQEGDRCLVAVADILSSQTARTADFIGRYGGEEFMAVLYDTDLAGAEIMAYKFCRAVRDEAIPHRIKGEDRVVTISCGIAVAISSKDLTLKDVIKRADEMLYKAKQGGRNRYECDVLGGEDES